MKLKNLLFATMIAGAFTACSSDNENIPTPPVDAEGTAYITLGVANTAVNTRVTPAPHNDAAIKDFVVLVFKSGDDKLEAIGYKTFETKSKADMDPQNVAYFTSPCIKVTSGEKKVLVLANTVTPTVVGETTTYAYGANGLTIGTTTLTSILDNWTYTPSGLTMGDPATTVNLQLSSQVYTVFLQKDVHNLLGFVKGSGDELPTGVSEATTTGHTPAAFLASEAGNAPVQMYRNVAKINFNGVTFHNHKKGQDVGSAFPGGSFEVTGIYALNGKSSTKIAAAGKWGSLETTGLSGFFGISDTNFDAWSTDNNPYIYNWTSYKGAASYKLDPTYKPTTLPTANLQCGVENTEGNFSFYAFENAGGALDEPNHTLLVIKGDIHYKVGITTENPDGTPDVAKDRYYVIPIGKGIAPANWPSDAAFNSRAKVGVMRNLEYNVSLTIWGSWGSNGTINPPTVGDIANMDVQIQVVPYGQVKQDVDFE